MGAVTGAGPRRGWWSRNAIALVALAVLVPATVGAIGWQEWSGYFQGRHPLVVPVEPGETAELAGATIGPAALVQVPDPQGFDAPAGARVLAAQVTVVPGEEPVGCSRPVLVELPTGRRWEAEYAPMGWRGELGCYEATAPVWINAPYLVPGDAGPFAVELELAHDGDERLHLLVEQP
ncbi:hypothetical protein [Agrococcus baldri]|uniref:Uncharacterized protein n=1 Tax=Agrococcus baldri TaxID=153730 RepID=A0AA87RLS3_9MICO|nr:hypothetical protein [Agrococcus baldri]GEK80472.1 hypothetical protein ABA31_18230 [Agrococcus baldri]